MPSLEARHGGPSRSVLALSTTLARAGHEVDLLATTPDAPSEQTDGTLRIRLFHRDWPERLCRSAGLRSALSAGDAEIVHHHALWLRTVHYAHRSAARHGARFVLSPRGMMSTWAWHHRPGRKRFARAFIHPGALEAVDGWHATSAEEEREIRALGFEQPVCVAPNGVAAPVPAECEAAAAYWREVCPAVASRPVALFYSRFHEKKRVLELIDLWLDHAPRDWLLLLVGLPQDYAPADLERYALKMSGAGRVQAFSGADCPAPYGIASLFLLPSHNENFGLVIAEALAHGVPALVTDTTPWTALNSEGAGWCVPWADYARTLQAALAEGPDQLRHRGAHAAAWVLRNYSWDRSAETLAEFYASLKPRSR